MRLALYQPDQPQNVGTLMRLAACLGVPADLIEPLGFPFDDKRLKRAGMDYLEGVDLTRHPSWASFQAVKGPGRVILMTTKASVRLPDFSFQSDDILLLGRESAGVPDDVHDAADARVRIPVTEGCRSLNVAVAGAMALGEALRQTRAFPDG